MTKHTQRFAKKAFTKPLASWLVLAIGIIGIFSINTPAHAYDFKPTSGTCYFFEANQLIKKQPCTTTGGGGAGGYSVAYHIGDKSYEYETNWNYNQELDDYHPETLYREDTINADEESYSFKYTTTIEYIREYKSLTPISDTASATLDNDDILYCYKTAAKNLDLCYH